MYKNITFIIIFVGHTLSSGLSWSNDGENLANLCDKGPDISLYSVSGFTAVNSGVIRPVEHPQCIQYANKASKFLAVGGKNTIVVWDINSNSQKKHYTLKDTDVSCLTFHPKDSHIACGNNNGSVNLLSVLNNSVSSPTKIFKDKVTKLFL